MRPMRTAVLRASQDFACSRWLRFEVSDERPLSFRGGQYLIVDTGLKLPDGRIYDNHYAWAFELKEGLVWRIREYMDSHYIATLFGGG